jgi:hypothetical protein
MFVWLLGIGAMLSLFISHQKKSRNGILIYKMFADVFWAAHYIFLGAMAGAIPNFVGVFREIIFINRTRRKFASSIVWPCLFILANLTLGIISFDVWYDILPIVASVFVTISLWINNPKLTKYISIPVSGAFLTYNIFVGSYIGILNEPVAILSILLFFARRKRR